MKEIKVDFSNEFVSNVAEGLGIIPENDYVTTQEWAYLQGTISSCVIGYYFSKMHVLAIKNALEKQCEKNGLYKRFDDTTVKQYIDIVTEAKKETGNIPLAKRVVPTIRMIEENYEEYKMCIERIDSEFENHQELIQLVAQKPLDYLEEEIASRKMITDYKNLDKHIAGAADYYCLQEVGIESYINKRRNMQQQENITVCKTRA